MNITAFEMVADRAEDIAATERLVCLTTVADIADEIAANRKEVFRFIAAVNEDEVADSDFVCRVAEERVAKILASMISTRIRPK